MSPPERPFPRIEARRLAAVGSLAGDALAGRPAAAGLFPSVPGTLPVGPSPRPPLIGPALPAEAFTVTTPGAATRLEAVLAGKGVVVTAGQQPGLFLGPLYTLYKALTAVRVAARIEARHGIPALAVFWVASDDHDWDEVAACRILDPAEDILTLRLPPPEGRRDRSVGETPLPETVVGLLAQFEAVAGGAVPGTSPLWLTELRDAYRPGRPFGSAFAGALAAAMADLDLAILDSAEPTLRGRAATLYGRVLASPERVTSAMGEGRERVVAAGYSPALTPAPDGVQIFYDDGKARRHVLHVGGGFDVGADEPLTDEELRARLESDPAAFTPAAALRPVLESGLLPVAATVLGPGEIAYWAQLPPVFETLDVPMPAIVGREAWVLVEPRVDRLLDKLGLDVATVEAEGRGIDDRWVARSRPKAVRDGLAELGDRLEEGFGALDAAVEQDLPGITSAVGKARHRTRQALDELSLSVAARVRERESIALGQAARVRAHLLPGGRPQERVVAAAQYLARHGRALVADLLAAPRVAGPGEPD